MEKTYFFYKKKPNGLESLEQREFDVLTTETINQDSNSNLWDEAHLMKSGNPDIGYIEPNVTSRHFAPDLNPLEFGAPANESDYDDFWPFPKNEMGASSKRIWHLSEEFSQLKQAWDTVDTDNIIRIAHLDTGYDPEHDTCPTEIIDKHLERNFVEDNNSAEDIGSQGWLNMPGHGCGTLSILAGNKVKLADYNHDDYLGIHQGIKIVPIRMSKSVVLWKNKAFVDAMNYIIAAYDDPGTRCHIVTMSMGGLPLKAWADVINRAYDKGIFVVTASGNNFGRLTPNRVVYPARFNRVMAACGVNFDYSPYYRSLSLPGMDNMQGNFGPRKVMRTSIAAFTPNVPWALIGTKNKVSIRGAGTSSATPQIAAAAALYYQKYYDELEALPQAWMKVEAIRTALKVTAAKTIAEGYQDDVELYFGNGIIQARKMLDHVPSAVGLEPEDSDTVSWPFIKLISGFEADVNAMNIDQEALDMFQTEILQLIQQSKLLQNLLEDEEVDFKDLEESQQRKFYNAVLEMPAASTSLKDFIRSLIL